MPGLSRARCRQRTGWRWRLVDLTQVLFEDHGVSVSEQTLSRVLWDMGYARLSARPRHHA